MQYIIIINQYIFLPNNLFTLYIDENNIFLILIYFFNKIHINSILNDTIRSREQLKIKMLQAIKSLVFKSDKRLDS